MKTATSRLAFPLAAMLVIMTVPAAVQAVTWWMSTLIPLLVVLVLIHLHSTPDLDAAEPGHGRRVVDGRLDATGGWLNSTRGSAC